MLTMNEKDKNEMLDKLLKREEQYLAKAWSVIMVDKATLMEIGVTSPLLGTASSALGALSSEYCYLGLTNNKLIIVTLYKHDVSKIRQQILISRGDIKNVKVKKSFIPGRQVVNLTLEQGTITLSFMKNAIGSDIEGQKEAVDIILTELTKIE